MKLLYKLGLTIINVMGSVNKAMSVAQRWLITFVLMLSGFMIVGANSAYAETQSTKQNLVCTGEFTNPITGMCWSCIMPIGISSIFYKGGGKTELKI